MGDGRVGEEGFLNGEGEDGTAWDEEFVSLFGRVTKREMIKYSPPIFIISFSLPGNMPIPLVVLIFNIPTINPSISRTHFPCSLFIAPIPLHSCQALEL